MTFTITLQTVLIALGAVAVFLVVIGAAAFKIAGGWKKAKQQEATDEALLIMPRQLALEGWKELAETRKGRIEELERDNTRQFQKISSLQDELDGLRKKYDGVVDTCFQQRSLIDALEKRVKELEDHRGSG